MYVIVCLLYIYKLYIYIYIYLEICLEICLVYFGGKMSALFQNRSNYSYYSYYYTYSTIFYFLHVICIDDDIP